MLPLKFQLKRNEMKEKKINHPSIVQKIDSGFILKNKTIGKNYLERKRKRKPTTVEKEFYLLVAEKGRKERERFLSISYFYLKSRE